MSGRERRLTLGGSEAVIATEFHRQSTSLRADLEARRSNVDGMKGLPKTESWC
jgi:hypothetical protein